LKVQHIWNAEKVKKGNVVFLQHGLFSSSECWIVNGKDSVGFRLAQEGYDVWLGNNRGTKFSRKHKSIDPNVSGKFFDYSFYELGQYDAPTQIDFVRAKTGVDKVTYIGHSQGTSQMFSALAEGHGKLKDKINLFVALAPVVNLGWTTNGLLKNIKGFVKTVQNSLWSLGITEFKGPHMTYGYRTFCLGFPYTCKLIDRFGSMSDNEWNNSDRVAIVEARPGSSGSTKQLMHYAQIAKTKEWRQFDYGSSRANRAKYGTDSPPSLDLSKIDAKVPIAMIVGEQDDLADPVGTMWAR